MNALRQKLDPLYKYIPPHLTLVFPFRSTIKTASLKQHIETAVQNIKPFDLTLNGISGWNNEYLFLDVIKGSKEIAMLHDTLYKGLLYEFLNKEILYVPHMTIGRFEDKEKWEEALKDLKNFNHVFTDLVEEIYVEVIDEEQNSTIELAVKL
ncbi:2'-5' RNA ligase family protein [Peribacillus kribbensis]|uniref:2'-5' RNA ligase family protein n=1 Tax=Peribacillus kribbensis TaxID=356658 RepID=UPI0024809726|nr:2'-5' RNA ligase family protein [Peribacillus kribbensis]